MDCAVWEALGDSSASDIENSTTTQEIDIEAGSNEAHQSANDVSMSNQDAELNTDETRNPLIKVS